VPAPPPNNGPAGRPGLNGRPRNTEPERPPVGRPASRPPGPTGVPWEVPPGIGRGRPPSAYDDVPRRANAFSPLPPDAPRRPAANGHRRAAPDDDLPVRAEPAGERRPAGAAAADPAGPEAPKTGRRRAPDDDAPVADEQGSEQPDDADPAADEADAEPADEQPPPGRRRGRKRAAQTGQRAIGTSGTGRSVARARADARTAKVAARTTEPTDDAGTTTDEPDTAKVTARAPKADARTAKVAARRSRPRIDPDEDAEGRLRVDHIDETLTRLTAAHAGLVLSRPDDEDDAEDEDPPQRARTAVRAGRYAVAAVAFLLVVAAGLGWVGRTRLDGALTQVAAVDVAADGVVDAIAQTDDENVLVLATDSGGSADATTRASTVTVVHRDARGDRTVTVTLPPRLEITRPPCERWDPTAAAYLDQTVPAEPRTTFDSAYFVGGPRCAVRAAQQVTGLAITRFVAVDLAATSMLVEAVGGVQVCVERPVIDSVLGPVVAAAGTDAFNGARAATLVRAADVRGEPAGGSARVQRQQRVLAAALERALAPVALLHPRRVAGLLPALGTTVVSTGTGVADLLALASAAGEVRAAPTEPQANSRGNVELQETEATALFTAVRTDAPLPPQNEVIAEAAPADVTADVLNASGRDGLAAEVAGTLGELGFRTADVRNADQPALATVVRFSPDRAEQAQLLAAAVPSASAVPDPGTSGVLELVLGRSFDGTVRASTAPEPAAETATAPTATCG
jgi:LCP family protein required for cell wall assembly